VEESECATFRAPFRDPSDEVPHATMTTSRPSAEPRVPQVDPTIGAPVAPGEPAAGPASSRRHAPGHDDGATRRRAIAVLERLHGDRELLAQRAEDTSGGHDLIKEVTGTSALDRAVASVETLIHRLDAPRGPATAGPREAEFRSAAPPG